jgi:hypothetical protein
LKLDVVPRWSIAVLGIEIDCLRIALVAGVIPPAVAEVDAPDEGDVVVGSRSTTGDDELLVMAAAPPDALVEQDLAARLVDLPDEIDVLLLAEMRLTRVRTPQQTSHVNAAACEVGEHVAHLRARAGETLIRVAFPIREVQPVVPLESAEHLVQAGEVLRAVDQHLDAVALRPRFAVAAPPVDLRGGITALLAGQEPVVRLHR